MRIRDKNLFLLIVPLILIGIPAPAFGFQQHGEPEGLIVHQVAHILFFSGIIVFYRQINSKKKRTEGWFEFNTSLLLFLAWNCLTFYGHWYHTIMKPDNFISVDDTTVALIVNNVWDLFFYISKFDHLVLVPAFLYLSLALFKWRKPA